MERTIFAMELCFRWDGNLHQIQPFEGDRDRVSITIHAAEIDDGLWDTWF